MQGEFLNVAPEGLKPYDVLDEGRVIFSLYYGYGPRPRRMEVGACHAEVEAVELGAGLRCLWRPVWDETTIEDCPTDTVRVFRGDLPGFFCTAEPDTYGDPCSSDRCSIRAAHRDRSTASNGPSSASEGK